MLRFRVCRRWSRTADCHLSAARFAPFVRGGIQSLFSSRYAGERVGIAALGPHLGHRERETDVRPYSLGSQAAAEKICERPQVPAMTCAALPPMWTSCKTRTMVRALTVLRSTSFQRGVGACDLGKLRLPYYKTAYCDFVEEWTDDRCELLRVREKAVVAMIAVKTRKARVRSKLPRREFDFVGRIEPVRINPDQQRRHTPAGGIEIVEIHRFGQIC